MQRPEILTFSNEEFGDLSQTRYEEKKLNNLPIPWRLKWIRFSLPHSVQEGIAGPPNEATSGKVLNGSICMC